MQGLMFKPEMTIANLKGLKSRTSRTRGLQKINENPDNWTLEYEELGTFYFVPKDRHCIATMVKCPFGQVGSELYGKETYTYVTLAEIDPWKDRAIADGSFRRMPNGNPVTMVYKADGVEIPCSWSSPMMMPENFSRYYIRPNKIIAQRINDISPDDCLREGIFKVHLPLCGFNGTDVYTWHEYPNPDIYDDPKSAFIHLWNKVNLKTGHGWDKNEWVWGIYYEVRLK